MGWGLVGLVVDEFINYRLVVSQIDVTSTADINYRIRTAVSGARGGLVGYPRTY